MKNRIPFEKEFIQETIIIFKEISRNTKSTGLIKSEKSQSVIPVDKTLYGIKTEQKPAKHGNRLSKK
jgi:hypothetical protein